MAENAETEGIHQRIATVAFVEIDLTGDRRQADAVPVMGDTSHHAGKEAAVGLGLLAITLNGTEAEGIHEEDGTRAHGEDVANDTTDTSGRSLERFDGARMIVTLDLECHRPSVADVDDAGILLTCFDKDAGAGGRELT